MHKQLHFQHQPWENDLIALLGSGGMEIQLTSRSGPDICWKIRTLPVDFLAKLRKTLDGQATVGSFSTEDAGVSYTLTPGNIVRDEFIEGPGGKVKFSWSSTKGSGEITLVRQGIESLVNLIRDYWT